MKAIHVECKPDELLVTKLGFTKKLVTHHTGKSRVFSKLQKTEHVLAMVDEDPGTAKTSYEKHLKLVKQKHGINYYVDASNNKVFVLKGKLEDWITELCKQNSIKLDKFRLPNKPNDLHNVINYKLNNFEKLIDHLLISNNPAIITLKDWLNELN